RPGAQGPPGGDALAAHGGRAADDGRPEPLTPSIAAHEGAGGANPPRTAGPSVRPGARQTATGVCRSRPERATRMGGSSGSAGRSTMSAGSTATPGCTVPGPYRPTLRVAGAYPPCPAGSG